MKTVTVTLNMMDQSFPEGTTIDGIQMMLKPSFGRPYIKVLPPTAEDSLVFTFESVEEVLYEIDACVIKDGLPHGETTSGSVDVRPSAASTGAVIIKVPHSMSVVVS